MSDAPKPTQFDDDREAHDCLFAFRQDRLIADDVLAFFAQRVVAARASLMTTHDESTDEAQVDDGVPRVLAQLAAGECTVEQAASYMAEREELLRQKYAEQYAGTLYDTFASLVQVPMGFDGFIPEALATTLMQAPTPTNALERVTWFAEAEARLRYLKADMCMKAREV